MKQRGKQLLDKTAFVEKARRLQGPMYRVACGMLRTEADREDAMQTALQKAWEKRHSLRDEALFDTWLIRILINACKTIIRKQKRLVPVAFLPEAGCEARDLSVRDAVERLPEKQRVCVMLHYLEGLPTDEIARLLNIPAATVRGRLHTALQRLRLALSEEEETA